jgi:integrase
MFKLCLDIREKSGVSHYFVFIRENGQPLKCIRTAFENACKWAGITNFRVHDLRHTCNTDMRKAGVHDTVIMKQTGHATMEMFLRYNTVDENDGREAVMTRDAYLKKQRAECPQCAPGKFSQNENDITI